MKLKKLNKQYQTQAKTTPKLEPLIEAAIEHVTQTAAVNVPYGLINIYGELCKAEIILMDKRGVQVVGLMLERLIKNHGWNAVNTWGFFVVGRGDVKLGEIIDGSVPYGYRYSVGAIARGLEKLIGSEPPLNTVRKTLDRLVESGEFIRPLPKIYQRIHRGF